MLFSEPKQLDRVVSGARYLTGGVPECNSSHRRSIALLCMLYKIRSNLIRCTLFIAFYLCRMCQYGLHAVLWSLTGFAPNRCRTSPERGRLLSISVSLERSYRPCIRWCETGRFLELGHSIFYWPNLPSFCLLLFSLYFIYFYRLVLWGWGLLPHGASIALSQPCIADPLNNNNSNIIYSTS